MMKTSIRLASMSVLVALFVLAIPSALAQDNACTEFTNADDYLSRGDGFYAAEDYEAALADYTCALELDPTAAGVYNDRGNAYSLLGDEEAAVADYTEAIERNYGELYIPYYNRGSSYWRLNDYEAAEADLTTSLTINPDYSSAYNNRGNVYYDQGDYERALEDYNRAIELRDEEGYIPYYNRSLVYGELGNFEQAIADATQALTLNPDYVNAYLSRGLTYLDLNDDHAAAEDFAEWVTRIETTTTARTITGSLIDEPLTFSEGTVYRISFDVNAGQVISIAARTKAGSALDPLIVLLDESGAPLIADDDSGVNLDSVIPQYTVSAGGTYTLLVSHAGGGSEGEAQLTLDIGEDTQDVFTSFDLAVGERAVVFTTGGDRLNLREGPGLNFEIVDRLAIDTIVTLLEGPRKNDGYAWWRVRTAEGVGGWSVERVETEQTLQLAIEVGDRAIVVTVEDLLNVRGGAGRGFDVIAQLATGTEVTVVEGPEIADGFAWWKLQTADGVEGWAVERVGEERTLVGSP
jgi:tetratricopeptide (TPR) repeat protein